MNTHWHALFLSIATSLTGAFSAPVSAVAQTQVGPGTDRSAVTGTTGTTIVVGDTIVSKGTVDGVRANGGDVALDMSLPLAPGISAKVSTVHRRSCGAVENP